MILVLQIASIMDNEVVIDVLKGLWADNDNRCMSSKYQTIIFETKTKPQTQFIGFWVKLVYEPMIRETLPPPLAAYK